MYNQAKSFQRPWKPVMPYLRIDFWIRKHVTILIPMLSVDSSNLWYVQYKLFFLRPLIILLFVSSRVIVICISYR